MELGGSLYIDQLKGNNFRQWFYQMLQTLEHLVETSVKIVSFKLVYRESPIVPSFWSELSITVFNYDVILLHQLLTNDN